MGLKDGEVKEGEGSKEKTESEMVIEDGTFQTGMYRGLTVGGGSLIKIQIVN